MATIAQRGAKVVIPSRAHHQQQRHIDAYLHKERHCIECWFTKLKHFWRVFSRFEETARNFLSFVYLMAFLIQLR